MGSAYRIYRGLTKDSRGRRNWVYGYYVGLGEDIIVSRNETGEIVSSFVEYTSIGQYTGINDRRGRDIYTGDMVTGSNCFKDVRGVVCEQNGAYKVDCNGEVFYLFNLHSVIVECSIHDPHESEEVMSKDYC